jgi:hypothetical protein
VAAQVTVSFRRILVLLVLVAALGTYVFVYEIPQAEKEGKKEKLLAVDKDAVTGVALVYPDREIELKKSDQTWRLTKPVDAAADATVVQTLVSTLVDAEVQKSIDEVPKDLESFGLDKPSVTARVTLKDGSQPPPVAVGKNTAIGGKTYVRRGEEPKLLLTTSSLQFGLNKQVKDLRDKSLVTFEDDAVTKVEIAPQGGETTTLVKKDKDAWTIEPGGQPADPTEVRSYLSSLRSARATDFPDDAPADLAKYGLATPRLAVTVTTDKDGAGKTLLLGNEHSEGTQKQVYAKRGDQATIYTLGDWTFRTLGKTASQFRDKTVLGFEPGRVGKAVVERKDGTKVAFTRAGDQWRFEGSDAETPKADTVSRFLDDLRDLRGAEIVAEPAGDLARWGLDAPDLRITLTDKDGKDMGTVLATKRDAKYYVTRSGSPTVFEARDYMVTRLDKQRADFLTSAPAEPAAPAGTPPAGMPPVDIPEEDDGDFGLPDEE